MIHEFALEPEAIQNWEDLRYFAEKFGIHHGRMIARFPNKWLSRVYASCRAGARETELSRIEEMLRRFPELLWRSNRPYDPDIDWTDNALASHAASPFHAIIARQNPADHPEIIVAREASEDHSRFRIPREIIVARDTVAFARCIAPLIRRSKHILFVDPYFRPDSLKWRRTLRDLLDPLQGYREADLRVEVHTKQGGDWSEAYQGIYLQQCEALLAQCVPTGLSLRVVLWKERDPGERFHARYVLTELGGIRFEGGLDHGNTDETTELSLLHPDIHRTRLAAFQAGAQVFDEAASTSLAGSRR